jgi:heat-inducible transcriptional repressor
MITQRQEKLLDFLIKEYITTAEPVSSKALKKITDLDVCGATIRNDLQELTESGYITQPHTSAGRIPTQKAYRYFVDKINSVKEKEDDFSDFIVRQIRTAHQQIEQEMRLAEELMKSLSEVSMTLNYTRIQKSDNLLEILEILGPSKTTHNENINLINKIIKQLENF